MRLRAAVACWALVTGSAAADQSGYRAFEGVFVGRWSEGKACSLDVRSIGGDGTVEADYRCEGERTRLNGRIRGAMLTLSTVPDGTFLKFKLKRGGQLAASHLTGGRRSSAVFARSPAMAALPEAAKEVSTSSAAPRLVDDRTEDDSSARNTSAK